MLGMSDVALEETVSNESAFARLSVSLIDDQIRRITDNLRLVAKKIHFVSKLRSQSDVQYPKS